LANSHLELGKKALEEVHKGNYGEAAVRGVQAAVPVLGPAEAGIEETAKTDLPRALGQIAGFIAAPKVVEGAVSAAPALAKIAKAPLEVDRSAASARVFGDPDIISRAGPDVKLAAGGVTPMSMDHVLIGTNQFDRLAGDAMEKYAARARAAKVMVNPGPQIIQATKDAISDVDKMENPEWYQDQIRRASFYDRPMTTDQLKTFLEGKNAKGNPFYKKTTSDQATAETAGTPPAVMDAQGDAMRDVLYNAWEPETQGMGPRQIGQRWAAVKDMKKLAERRRVGAEAEKPLTPLGGAARAVGALPKDILGAGRLSEAEGPVSAFIGKSDATIRKAFKDLDAGPTLPEPPSPNHPWATSPTLPAYPNTPNQATLPAPVAAPTTGPSLPPPTAPNPWVRRYLPRTSIRGYLEGNR